MNPRTLQHAFTRKSILLLLAGGIAISATGTSLLGGLALVGFGFAAGLVWANRDGLAEMLEWNDVKKAKGISRELKFKEQQALKKIHAYSDRVAKEVFEPALAEEIIDRAWTMVAEATGQNATRELEAFIESFPPIGGSATENKNENITQGSLSDRLSHSVERRQRIEREIDQVDLP